MLKFALSLTAFSALLALPVIPAAAQEDAPPPRPFVYSTYFQCDSTNEWLADMIVETVHKPVYDAAVEDGTISAWGWLAHHTGGAWRRSIFRVAPTFAALQDGGDVITAKIREANPDAAGKLGEICNVHDDYVWRWARGSSGGIDAVKADLAKAGVSTYMVCDMAKQGRADELMALFAPVYDRHVAAGELSSWAWFEHSIGGEYRRLLTMRGADHKSVPAAWAAIVEEIEAEHAAQSAEFDAICYTHQDYLWDIAH